MIWSHPAIGRVPRNCSQERVTIYSTYFYCKSKNVALVKAKLAVQEMHQGRVEKYFEIKDYLSTD